MGPSAPFQLHEPKLTAPYSSSSPAPGPSHQAVCSSLGDAGFAWRRQEDSGDGDPSRLSFQGSVLKPFSSGWCLATSALALGAQGGQHRQVVSNMGVWCQFCSPVEILKQTVTKQVDLTPLACQLCPWQPGFWEESTEDMTAIYNHQIKQSQAGLLCLLCEWSLSFQAWTL